MKKIAIALLFVFILFSTSPFTTLADTVFTPTQYTKITNSAEVYIDSFTALPGQAKIIVQNGEEVDSKKGTTTANQISSAAIFINEEEIFSPADFKESTFILEAPINLLQDNILRVELNRNRGSKITISIVRPGCTIQASPQIISRDNPSRITWNCNDSITCDLQPDYGSVNLNDFRDVSPTQTTTYTITGTDSLGNTCSSSTDVNVEIPLEITVIYPPDGTVITKPQISFMGQLKTKALYTSVYINGEVALVYENTFMLNSLDLKPGENIITLKANDSDKNSATKNITLTRIDTSEGWLVLDLKDYGGVAPLSSLLTITPYLQNSLDWSTSVLLDNGPTKIDIVQTGDGRYELTFPEPGLYTLIYEVRDTLGNTFTENVYASVDPPFTQEDFQEMADHVQQLENTFFSLIDTVGIKNARIEVVNQANDSPVFTHASLSSSTISLTYKGWFGIILDLPDPDAPPKD